MKSTTEGTSEKIKPIHSMKNIATDNIKLLTSLEQEDKVSRQIIDVLKKNEFTFSNFQRVVEKVKTFFKNNATI